MQKSGLIGKGDEMKSEEEWLLETIADYEKEVDSIKQKNREDDILDQFSDEIQAHIYGRVIHELKMRHLVITYKPEKADFK